MRSAFSLHVAKFSTFWLWFLLLMTASAHAQELVPATPGSSAGQLILRGELIPPPYSVEIVGDSLTVNGKSVARPYLMAAAITDAAVSDNVRDDGGRETLFREFWSAWDSWCEQLGVAAAQDKALQYWRAAPGVLFAGFLNPQQHVQLKVQFVGEAEAESIELQPPSSDDVSPAEARVQILQQRAAALRESLALGELVILQDEGYSYSSAPGEGAALLHKLAAIAETVVDPRERYAAVRQMIPDDDMARDIAEHFQP